MSKDNENNQPENLFEKFYLQQTNEPNKSKNLSQSQASHNLTSSQFSKFPGLLWYFKNLYREINSELKLIEEINEIETNLNYDNTYIGYNYVDPDNQGIYENLNKLCNLGEYFDTDINDCTEATKTPVEYCEHYANKNYQCLNCKDEEIYLLISDGTCHSDCSPNYFGNDLINQCRPCDSSCYTCNGKEPNQCLSCTGNLYFYDKEKTCIENCEIFSLTKSVSLINVNEIVPIGANNFNYIHAMVIDASSTEYVTLWKF